MKYFFECALTALVGFVVAILTFLFSRDTGLVAGACFAGACSGIGICVSYTLGGMMIDEDGFDGKRFSLMLAAGIVAGIVGGLIMLT